MSDAQQPVRKRYSTKDPRGNKNEGSKKKQATPKELCPYASFSKYLPDEEYDPQEHEAPLKSFRKYFEGLRLKPKQRVIQVEYKHFLRNCSDMEDIEEAVQSKPSLILGLLQVAAEEQLKLDSSANIEKHTRINVRLLGYTDITSLREIRAQMAGQLVSIQGTVVKISSPRPYPISLCFRCNLCATEMTLSLEEGKYSAPKACSTEDCKAKPNQFQPLYASDNTTAVDWQKIRIQEQMSQAIGTESGRIPRIIECEVKYELVDVLKPGDIATLTGIVKYSEVIEFGKNRKKGTPTMSLYIDVNSVVKVNHLDNVTNDGVSDIEADEMREFSCKDNVFEILVHSVCPSIYGHDLVKMGFLLALFGGRNRSNKQTSNAMTIRSDSHVLVVGDPGMGKSQMLSYIANIAPRSVYVCSNTTTSSGLTVTLSKEGGSGEFTLEAGALVLSDEGVCCIDEFDKMTQHEALLEAMEQQCISIAKAGVLCSLPARTSILAAANPVGGHYNLKKTVSENLKMSSALLSRFDLVFILLDRPDANMDKFLSNHVMNMHSKSRTQFPASTKTKLDDESPVSGLQAKLVSSRGLQTVSPDFLKKYIAYCKKYINPRLTPEAAVVLQTFYLELRKQHAFNVSDSVPITTRQLESMVRLAEARAKCEMRDIVTAQDAEDIVELMKKSLLDSYKDEKGKLKTDRSQFGTGMSKRKEVKRFVARLQQEYMDTSNDLFSYQQLYQIATDMRIQFGNFKDFLESVNNQNYLLRKPNSLFKLALS